MKKKSILILTLCFCFFNIQVISQALKTSNKQNINTLNIETESHGFKKSQNSKRIFLNINTESVIRYKNETGDDIFQIEGAIPGGVPGNPLTYVYPVSIRLEKGAIVEGIKLINGKYVEILEKINLAPKEKPLIWNNRRTHIRDNYKNPDIYNNNAVFPSKAFTFNIGESESETIVNIKLCPLFVNPATHQAFLLSETSIVVYYTIKNKINNTPNDRSTDAQNIILTTEAFLQAAETLKDIHENQESTTTEIITREWIESNYAPATEPEAPGYANTSTSVIKSGYNYELAKKITAYFLDSQAHPNLESICLLGDAEIIPPSYYFFVAVMPENDDFNNWPASDLYYASPDYDLVLNYQIGRIPVNTVAEADHVVDKIQNWINNRNSSWLNNMELIGGSAFNTINIIGETISLDPVNQGFCEGLNINKKFASLGNETIADVLPLFNNENTGIIFHIGHGSGDGIYFDNDESVLYSDLMSLASSTKYPVLLSIACMNGGYDAELINNPLFNNCFAEGILRSNAGGIGYFGGVRTNAGDPVMHYNPVGQRIVTNETYMAKMLVKCMKAYNGQNSSFGEIYKEAVSEYVAEMIEVDIMEKYTIYCFTFLGDPVLNLLPQQSNTYQQVDFSTIPFPAVPGSGTNGPTHLYNKNIPLPLEINGQTDSPFVNIKIYKISQEGVSTELLSTTDEEPPFQTVYDVDDDDLVQVRFETHDSKESWLYFIAEGVDNLRPVTPILHEITDPFPDYELVWSRSRDFDGSVDSYTIKEMIRKNGQVSDQCENTDNWNNIGFSINNDGRNGTNCFYSGSGGSLRHVLISEEAIEIDAEFVFNYWVKTNLGHNPQAFFEISLNGEEYVLIDAFAGVEDWQKRELPLGESFSGNSYFFRFTYFTEPGNTDHGYYIDDVSPVIGFQEVNYYENIIDTMYYFTGNLSNEYFYRVCAIDNTGEVSFWSNRQTVSTSTGILNYNVTENSFIVTKSKSNRCFQIKSDLPVNNNTKVSIYNVQGQIVYSKAINSKIAEVDLSDKPAGIYIFNFTDSYISQSVKIIMR